MHCSAMNSIWALIFVNYDSGDLRILNIVSSDSFLGSTLSYRLLLKILLLLLLLLLFRIYMHLEDTYFSYLFISNGLIYCLELNHLICTNSTFIFIYFDLKSQITTGHTMDNSSLESIQYPIVTLQDVG